MDSIFIDGLLARCIIGVNPEERRERQEVVITLTLGTDLRPAGRSDCIADTLDYRAIKKRVFTAVEASQFLLLEALCAHVAAICLQEPKVTAVTVRIEKPAALRFARSVGVEITRERGVD